MYIYIYVNKEIIKGSQYIVFYYDPDPRHIQWVCRDNSPQINSLRYIDIFLFVLQKNARERKPCQ